LALLAQLVLNFTSPSLKLKIGALLNWPSASGYCPRPSIAPEPEDFRSKGANYILSFLNFIWQQLRENETPAPDAGKQ